MGNYLSGESTVWCPTAMVSNLCITRYVRKNWQCNMLCKLIALIYTHIEANSKGLSSNYTHIEANSKGLSSN